MVCGTVSQAHHSISGMYDSSRKVTIEGVIAQFQFVNPHPFVLMDVSDGNGTAQRWHLEMDSRGELARIGFTSATLKQGDRIIVSGSLSRRDASSLYISRLDRPSDGFGYEQVGSSPRLRPRSS
jgi:hypothetical protein